MTHKNDTKGCPPTIIDTASVDVSRYLRKLDCR